MRTHSLHSRILDRGVFRCRRLATGAIGRRDVGRRRLSVQRTASAVMRVAFCWRLRCGGVSVSVLEGNGKPDGHFVCFD